ncbi:MAG: mandelate racemase/muconate lactonizing enzyme family protein [Chloroflexi bacterium]|nr:mandelate racemase/muconate lactonizing enzyme family protein [Chloroflexota bacterium]
MKITEIRPFLVSRSLLLRVYTDQGIVGNGEAGLWAHHEVVLKAIQELSAYYIGKDPFQREHHFQAVSRNTHFMGAVLSAALSAYDMAMWDIVGQAVGLPVYQLLGGKCRDKVKVFANVDGNTLDERARSAQEGVAKGYTSLRTTPMFRGFEKDTPTKTIKNAVAIVRAIREAVGDEIDLGLEIHRNLETDAAILLAHELEPYRILYYEDPLRPESVDAVEYIARHVNLPIATGERFYNIYQFKDLVDRKIVSLVRADMSLAGGYTQVKKIAGLAEAAFVGFFPHLMGSPVNIAAFVQLDAAVPNYALMESMGVDTTPLNAIIDQPLTFEKGYILVPDRPGIGVQILEDKLKDFPFQPLRPPTGFAADGSVAH